MKYLAIHKAQGIGRNDNSPVEGVTIVIREEMPTDHKALIEAMVEQYDVEGEKLAEALLASLPQGTIEPLIIHLLKARISLYVGTLEGRK